MRIRPLTETVSKEDADGLVMRPKIMLRVPVVRLKNGCLRILTDNIYWSDGSKTNLTVDAKVAAKRPRRGSTPSVALIWRGRNIRCIDWKLKRPFPDGTVIEGWHEHLWDERKGREVGIPFQAPAYGADEIMSQT